MYVGIFNRVKILYAFPEPLPLERARGVQVAHAVVELARQGLDGSLSIELAYVPEGEQHPTRYYGLEPPDNLAFTPLSRAPGWPLSWLLPRLHSNRFFMNRLEQRIAALQATTNKERLVVMVRHLKLAAMLIDRHPALPLAYEAHEVFGDTAHAAKQNEQSALEQRVVQRAALVLANSAATAARLKERYGERRIDVLPNGVDWPDTLPAKDWNAAGQHIIYSGSFFGWKGVSDLVQAAGDLPGCRITLLGGNAEQIERERSHLPANGAEVVFRGHVPHGEVAQALGTACIAVLPNRDDPDSRFTSPIKLYEYMAAGCAIVASDLPALREVLADDAAVWVKAGDAHSIAKGIRSLADSPDLARAIGERVREQARSLTWQARAEKLAALLSAIPQS